MSWVLRREGFDLVGVGVFGGVDLVQPLVEGGGLLLTLGGLVGGGGGELFGGRRSWGRRCGW